MTEQSRQEFEKWVAADVLMGSERSPGDHEAFKIILWHVWQASRAEIVVTLPAPDVVNYGEFYLKSTLTKAIESQGIKVK